MSISVVSDKPKFLTGSDDRVFKTLVNSGEKGKIILEAILKTVFEETVEVIEFLTVEQPLEKVTERKKTLDCLVKVKDKYVNVEINLNDYDIAKAVRNFAYLCSFYSQNTRKGQTYDTETLCVQVNINFGYSPYNRSDKIVTKAYMQDEDGVIIKNFAIWNMYVENIKRLCYNNPKERDKYRYILMLDEDKDNLELFYPSDDIVSIYKGELMRLNSDADFVWDITEEEDAQKLFNTRMYLAEKEGLEKGMAQGIERGIEQGIEQGIERGIERGIEQTNLDNARKMKEKGFSIKDIQDITGLSEEEIKEL